MTNCESALADHKAKPTRDTCMGVLMECGEYGFSDAADMCNLLHDTTDKWLVANPNSNPKPLNGTLTATHNVVNPISVGNHISVNPYTGASLNGTFKLQDSNGRVVGTAQFVNGVMRSKSDKTTF